MLSGDKVCFVNFYHHINVEININYHSHLCNPVILTVSKTGFFFFLNGSKDSYVGITFLKYIYLNQ